MSLFKYNLYWTLFSSFSFGSWSPTRDFYKLRTWLREVTAFPLFSAFPEISAIKVPEKEIAMLLMEVDYALFPVEGVFLAFIGLLELLIERRALKSLGPRM